MHQERMLNSSSSAAASFSSTSSSSSSFSSSSSSLISANDLHRSSISASSSSSSYNPIPFDHHPQQPFHPTPQSPHPHYYHLHHFHAQYPSIDSPHHLHPYTCLDSMHHVYPFPQASITTGSIDNSHLSGDLYEQLISHNHTKDSHCQAQNSTKISKSVLNTNESISNHGYSVATKCDSTDCSPRSVIHHGRSSSSAPSTSPHWLSTYYANLRTNASMSPATAYPHQAPELSMTRPHHPTLHETSQGAFSHAHMQSNVLDHHQMPTPWSSPSAIHHHYNDVCSSFNTSSPHSGYNNHKAGTEKVYKGGGMRKNPKALERGSSRSADLHKQREIEHRKSGYFSGSAVEDKPYMMMSNDSGADYGSIKQQKQTATALRTEQGNFNVSVDKCTAAKPMYISMRTSILQADHEHKVLQRERSVSCDLRSSKHGTMCATPTRCTGGMQQAGCVNSYKIDEVQAPRSPDALSNYADGSANIDSNGNVKGRAQLGSKWEDAEKWVRPPNYDQHASGCRGFSNLSLLRMSNCVNAGTAVKSQHIHLSNGLLPPAILSSHECVSHYSSDFSASGRANYRSSGSESARLYAAPESIMPPHAKPFPPHPQFAADQHIKEQVIKQRTNGKQNLKENYTQKARQKQYCAASSGSGSNMDPKKLARGNDLMASPPCGLGSQEEGSACGSDWNVPPLPHYTYPKHQLMTDRFASGEIMSCATTSYAGHNDENLLIMPTMQGNVPMPMVSLREVGTQMSSVDGSGSISRFTSKNGSPQKPISPTRHNTPAYMRSLNGSTNSISNLREGGKKAIDLEELVECHRAKLELHALSEGERIHSFHRTISNWSSREMEEADLSRSLRHSANLDEDHTSKDHPWPSQSFSWDKHEDSKLAKLLIKEARIQAWEDKKKSKAEAQLKRLEENLAKKRSQTTNKIMGNLGAAQKKAEEMRASVYARQRGATAQKAHRFRHRSLSPLSRCICISTLE